MGYFVGIFAWKNRIKLQNPYMMTKTKIKLLSIAAGTMLAACSASTPQSDAYVVTATVPVEYNGATAFLVNFDNGEKIDSVTVPANFHSSEIHFCQIVSHMVELH